MGRKKGSKNAKKEQPNEIREEIKEEEPKQTAADQDNKPHEGQTTAEDDHPEAVIDEKSETDEVETESLPELESEAVTEEQPEEPQPSPPPQQDFTPFEASERLKVNEQAITLWIQHGHLKLNQRRNITVESLEKWEKRLEDSKNA